MSDTRTIIVSGERFSDRDIENEVLHLEDNQRDMRLGAIITQLKSERDSRTAEIREYLRQCEGNAEDNIEDTTANEFLEWNAVAGALHDILREFDKRWK